MPRALPSSAHSSIYYTLIAASFTFVPVLDDQLHNFNPTRDTLARLWRTRTDWLWVSIMASRRRASDTHSSSYSPLFPYPFCSLSSRRLIRAFFLVLTYWDPNQGAVCEWSPPDAPDDDPVTPSVLAFKNNRASSWGHSAVRDRNRVSWTKLCVEGAPVVPVDSLDIKALLGDEGFKRRDRRQVERVIRDYLAFIREAFCRDENVRQLQRTQNLPHIDWHFSMPACWTAEGVHTMRSAVEGAGYLDNDGAIFYCSEAMAAAIAVSYRVRADIAQVGDRLLVCDVGGATTVSGS